MACGLRHRLDPSLLAISIQIMSDAIGLFSFLLQVYIEVKTLMISSARAIELTKIPKEDGLVRSDTDDKLRK